MANECQNSPRKSMAALMITALGVVYGDIGTSPLYTLKECFHGPHAIAVSHDNVMGVLSLIFWSLTVVITIKYVSFVTKADNHGEGGTFALLALIHNAMRKKMSSPRFFKIVPYLALCSAAMVYSDGIITPTISVLSAVEGLSIVSSAATKLVVPITCGILVLLFLLQKYGTARIGGIFGPVMLLWFAALAASGLYNIISNPAVAYAINPYYALAYFKANHLHGIIILGAVVLCVTGGESLYVDLGHFSRVPIKRGWLFVAYPALLLNYLGQGAVILKNSEAAYNPFYHALPPPLLIPMLLLATMATVIASQAVISGVYSLTQQAVHLGFLPRMRLVHTSPTAKGQIYLPTINALLMVACIGLALIFQNSSSLAAAYGLAVIGAMTITSILYFSVVYLAWNWPLWKAAPLLALFLLFDLPFLSVNLIKVIDGGWLPMLAAVILITVMTTWKKGRAYLRERFVQMSMPLTAFLTSLRQVNTNRSPGIGVFMTMNQNLTPMPLARSIALIHTVPETIIILTIATVEVPYVPKEERVRLNMSDKDVGLYRMTVTYGYMQRPDMEEISECSRKTAMHLPLYDSTFYLGHETILASAEEPVMRPWRRALFIFLSNNAWNASTFFNIPSSRVVEIGTHLPV
ncbi:MAG: KUP/HAK/KT family potassium transporter [Desulfobulbaceae bacterium]|jgi:KUP system potassium uptake protein|nr:KUP/HAK/KT family potassium transporter [Desulfobulbaceae bacterium]